MRRRGAIIAAILLAALSASAAPTDTSSQDPYNEGNAHARAGEWGLAVVDYQRARLLAPNDPDVEANLRYVLAAAKVEIPVSTLAERLSRVTTPDVAAALGLVGLLMLGCALLLARIWVRLGVIVVGGPLVAFAIVHALGLRPLLHSAVVVGGPATVQASPVPMADSLLSIPEATIVMITAERPDYLLIRTQSGMSGWISRAHLVRVVPPDSAPAL